MTLETLVCVGNLVLVVGNSLLLISNRRNLKRIHRLNIMTDERAEIVDKMYVALREARLMRENVKHRELS